MRPANDSSLRTFLDAESDADAWQALDALLSGDLGTVMRDSVARHLSRSQWMTEHVDDVLGELRVKMTERLWLLRRNHGDPIENILAYGAVSAERESYAFLRRQFPERTRLRNRLRYAVTHHPGMSLDVSAHGVWLCRSTAGRVASRRGTVRAMVESPRTYATTNGIDLSAALPALTEALLSSCAEPVEFDRLVEVIASLLGVSDAPPATSSTQVTNPLDRIIDPGALISAQLEQRASLVEVWTELVALPLRQRTALLLNLRDTEGGAALHLLPGTLVVNHAGLAAILEISEDDLNAIWHELPLDDLAIGVRLGASRQQVINLRKSARARLARRLERNS